MHRTVHNSSCKVLKYFVIPEKRFWLRRWRTSCLGAIQQRSLPMQQGVVSSQQPRQSSLSGRTDQHIKASKVMKLLGVLCELKELFLLCQTKQQKILLAQVLRKLDREAAETCSLKHPQTRISHGSFSILHKYAPAQIYSVSENRTSPRRSIPRGLRT